MRYLLLHARHPPIHHPAPCPPTFHNPSTRSRHENVPTLSCLGPFLPLPLRASVPQSLRPRPLRALIPPPRTPPGLNRTHSGRLQDLSRTYSGRLRDAVGTGFFSLQISTQTAQPPKEANLMPRIAGTSDAQSRVLRTFHTCPGGPPPDQWPSPTIFRRWLRRDG
jgi:hypothetical protein